MGQGESRGAETVFASRGVSTCVDNCSINQVGLTDDDIWHKFSPDQWSPAFLEKKKLAWRTKYKDNTYNDFYKLLLKDEGYWHQVNSVIANLPPQPGKVHSSLDDNFYLNFLPWAGVSVDWLEDSSVTATKTIMESGNTIQRPIRTIFHYNHKRPDGMTFELAALNVIRGTEGSAEYIIDRSSKVVDSLVDVVGSGAKVIKAGTTIAEGIADKTPEVVESGINIVNAVSNVGQSVGGILKPGPGGQNIVASTFSLTTIVLVIGGVATAALVFK